MSAHPTAEEMTNAKYGSGYAHDGMIAGIKAERARMAKHLRECAAVEKRGGNHDVAYYLNREASYLDGQPID